MVVEVGLSDPMVKNATQKPVEIISVRARTFWVAGVDVNIGPDRKGPPTPPAPIR